MKFSFKHFQFDCEQQILTQDGTVLTLNEKPAQLLTLFLHDSDRVHKKSEILDFVWPNRVVTDQVVFQNISYLRSLFGSDAIKTFTKKGYQWQLPLEVVVEDNPQVQELANLRPNIKEHHRDGLVDNPEKKRNSLQKFVLTNKVFFPVIVVTLLLVNVLWFTKNTTAPVKPEQSSSQELTDNRIYSLNLEKQQLSFLPLAVTVANQTLFDSPFSTWQRHAIDKSQLLVATRLYSVQDKKALRFHIQGEKHGWHDYIFAENEQQATAQLRSLIVQLLSSNYFAISSNHQLLANLVLMINEQPTDELLNQQLIKLTFKSNDLDRATALINQQLAVKPSLLRQGLLELLKTDITMRNKHWPIAKNSAEQALTIFQELDLPQLEARALIESSWNYLFEKNFRLGMQVLNQAASKARESKEPLLEVNAHIIQSFMASKSEQLELAHTQLDLAKEITDFHQLSDEHQVPIQNNLAWISKSPDDALLHHQNILNMPFSPQYEYDFYTASKKIRNAYIKQQEWDKAFNTIMPWQRASFQSLTRANIEYAQGHWRQGLEHAQMAFQSAQVEHHRVDALNAALLVLQNQTNYEKQLDTNEFQTFIKQNSTRIWLDQNSIALESLTKDQN